MLNYSSTTYGYLTIKQDDARYKIDIREANCLCAFIHVRKATEEELKRFKNPDAKYIHSLYSFFCDEQHVQNILKNNNGKLFGDPIINISLNLYHKQSWKLLKIFTKLGYKVTCYYKEEKSK